MLLRQILHPPRAPLSCLCRGFSTSSTSSSGLVYAPGPRTHLCGELRVEDVGKRVTLQGWVSGHRALGGLLFMTLRDAYGTVQVVHSGGSEGGGEGGAGGASLMTLASGLRLESVVSVEGVVRAREGPPVAGGGRRAGPVVVNATGGVEVALTSLSLISSPPTGGLPLLPSEPSPGEDLRLSHRHLDLRRDVMQRNLRLRSLVLAALRNALLLHSHPPFVEVDTPTLTRSSPEGAREFLVPSRGPHWGGFYALSQSPQQYKQLLMVGGLDRYFQVARCYRDEGGRADRQPEFSQLDVEMAFPSGEEEVMGVGERCIVEALKAAGGVGAGNPSTPSLLPQYSFAHFSAPLLPWATPTLPLPRLTYAHVMGTYGSDKPDRRLGLPIANVTGSLHSFVGSSGGGEGGGEGRDAGAPIPPHEPSLHKFTPGLFTVQALRIPGLGKALSRKEASGLAAFIAGASFPAKEGGGGLWGGV